VNNVIVSPSQLGNYKIADKRVTSRDRPPGHAFRISARLAAADVPRGAHHGLSGVERAASLTGFDTSAPQDARQGFLAPSAALACVWGHPESRRWSTACRYANSAASQAATTRPSTTAGGGWPASRYRRVAA
jgi:hypothetical protein